MPRHRTWRDLWPGLAVAGALVFAVAWVLLYARVGAIRGDTYRLYSVTSDARGVLKGSEVWLSGQKIGAVSDIRFRSVTTDSLQRLLVELQILERYRPFIRRGAQAQIRAGGTLLGQPVFYIASGSTDQPALEPGDTIVALPQPDTETLASEVARLGRTFPGIARDAKAIHQHLMSVSGVARLEDDAVPLELDVLRRRAARLGAASRGDGTIGRFLNGEGGTLRSDVGAVLARVDTLGAMLASERTSFGRFRRDTTLAQQITELRDEVARVRALAASPDGTFGRARADDAIRLELQDIERQLDALIADVKRRPLRYLHF